MNYCSTSPHFETQKQRARVACERLPDPCGNLDFEEHSETSLQAPKKTPSWCKHTHNKQSVTILRENRQTCTYASTHKHISCRDLQPASPSSMTTKLHLQDATFPHILLLSLYEATLLISPLQILLDVRKKTKANHGEKKCRCSPLLCVVLRFLDQPLAGMPNKR